MRKTLVTLTALAVGALGGFATSVALTPDPANVSRATHVIVTYPCVEDEAYTYWPGYPDPVCVHHELLEATARGEAYTPGYGVRVP